MSRRIVDPSATVLRRGPSATPFATVLRWGQTGAGQANADRHRPHPKPDSSAPQLETLDRGLVAISTDEGVFLSWRLLADEATGASDTGLTGTNFDVLRDGRRIATVTDSTNYLDTAGDGDSKYSVVPKEEKRGKGKGKHPGKGRHETVRPLNQDYLSIPLQRPADGVTPDGEPYTYSANDASVADVDGDGKSELMMKTAPGTKSTTYRNGKAGKDRYITMLKQDRRAGYSHSDDYRLSPEGFREHLAEMFREWDTREEVTSGAVAGHRRGGARRHGTGLRAPAQRGRLARAGRLLHHRLRPLPQRPQHRQPAQLPRLHRRRAGVPHRVRRQDRPGTADRRLRPAPR